MLQISKLKEGDILYWGGRDLVAVKEDDKHRLKFQAYSAPFHQGIEFSREKPVIFLGFLHDELHDKSTSYRTRWGGRSTRTSRIVVKYYQGLYDNKIVFMSQYILRRFNKVKLNHGKRKKS